MEEEGRAVDLEALSSSPQKGTAWPTEILPFDLIKRKRIRQ